MNRSIRDTIEFQKLVAALAQQAQLGAIIEEPILGQQIGMGELVHLEVLSSLVDQEKRPMSFSIDHDETIRQSLKETETALWDFMSSRSSQSKNYNDESIVLKLIVGSLSILLTGDSGERIEQALIHNKLITPTSILKVGHHGSKTSTSKAFLEQVRPEIAVISSGQNNPYRHPHPEVLNRLEQAKVRVLRTDQLGDIEVRIADGRWWWHTATSTQVVDREW